MTTLFRDDNTSAVQVLRPNSTQVVDGSSASAQTTTFTESSVVYLASATAFNLAVGDNPTATSSTMYVPAGVPTYIKVNTGEKIAVLGASVNITTMN